MLVADGKIGTGLRFPANSRAFLDFGSSYRHECLGNLNHCPNGLTFAFWLRPDEIRKAERSPFLTTGYNGIGVFWADSVGELQGPLVGTDPWVWVGSGYILGDSGYRQCEGNCYLRYECDKGYGWVGSLQAWVLIGTCLTGKPCLKGCTCYLL